MVAGAATSGVSGSVGAELNEVKQGQGFGQGHRGGSGRFLIKHVRLGKPPLGMPPLDGVVRGLPGFERRSQFGGH